MCFLSVSSDNPTRQTFHSLSLIGHLLRLREVKKLTQSHTARRQGKQDLSPSLIQSLTLEGYKDKSDTFCIPGVPHLVETGNDQGKMKCAE